MFVCVAGRFEFEHKMYSSYTFISIHGNSDSVTVKLWKNNIWQNTKNVWKTKPNNFIPVRNFFPFDPTLISDRLTRCMQVCSVVT